VEKWCYFFKYASSTKEADLRKIVGKDQAIERAYEELNQFNWSEEELMIYEEETKRIMDNQAADDYIFEQGMEKGIEKGIETKAIDIARSMLKKGFEIKVIKELTGLSKEAIEKCKQD
jgi:predicted transposase/invertase (TIGR01784 family)